MTFRIRTLLKTSSALLFAFVPAMTFGQNRAYIIGNYFYLADQNGDILERSSRKVAPHRYYVYFHQGQIRVDDDGGSIYRFVSDAYSKEDEHGHLVKWEAIDEKGNSCKVGIFHSKEAGTVFFFADYPKSYGQTQSYNYNIVLE